MKTSDLRQIFERLREHGLSINSSKCMFGVKSISYLGYSITKEGIRPLEERVRAIMEYQPQGIFTELRRFLGIVNFYRRFVPNAASYLTPLKDNFAEGKKQDTRPVP